MPDPRKVLILGGTGEARRLAALAVEAFGADAITTSLAGVTKAPAPVAGRVRTGGFGGAEGLALHLKAEGYGALVDATHPFAATISAHAAEAAAVTATPRLAVVRPPWPKQPGDQWIEVGGFTEARFALDGRERHVFLAIGRKELEHFRDLWGFRFLVRLVEAPDTVLTVNDYRVVVGRGPFAVEDEIELMQCERVTTLVAKASGGEAGYAKIAAARALGVTVVMVRRPPPPAGPTVATPEQAITWLRRLFEARR
ncbi:MAG: cobalt-precorrin-6A reductase [Alphaproteobacteria bacterium]